MEHLINIGGFILDSFLHMWPYLFITIPMAVAVQLSGAARFINKALTKNPVVSILLATLAGAFSPFCSCGVIPVVASLLIGGVPLAPVMSFWIASPSMDPEIFFLSVATIGWELSVWRLVATLVISLLSGYLTHFAFQSGVLGKDILRKNQDLPLKKTWERVTSGIENLATGIFTAAKELKKTALQFSAAERPDIQPNSNCCLSVDEAVYRKRPEPIHAESSCGCSETCSPEPVSFQRRILSETWKASVMVAKFMTLAFFINALIRFYVPQDFISGLLGGNNSFPVLIASLVGIPVYTSNITALPLVSGLLALGMNPGAALAFLISGPTTTLPAMVAVWGIVNRKIFLMYISFALTGAILFGLLYNFIH